jgi:hypothetical protein
MVPVAIIGGVVGGGIALILVLALIIYLWRRRGSSQPGAYRAQDDQISAAYQNAPPEVSYGDVSDVRVPRADLALSASYAVNEPMTVGKAKF